MMLATVATNSEKRLQIVHEAGHALDHPVPTHFLEGRYLKFIIARVSEMW
jgi:23S rRNA (cytosine1962-C5)-methyltransferase